MVTIPSPYGVLFILMEIGAFCLNDENFVKVSVSLRSIIHSYAIDELPSWNQRVAKFPSPYGVLFILIILVSRGSVKVVKDFHLLTEYHSFLLEKTQNLLKLKKNLRVSVSLWSIIHSYYILKEVE